MFDRPSVEPLTDAVGLFDRVRHARVSEASGPWVPVREQKSLAEPPLGQTEPLLCCLESFGHRGPRHPAEPVGDDRRLQQGIRLRLDRDRLLGEERAAPVLVSVGADL